MAAGPRTLLTALSLAVVLPPAALAGDLLAGESVDALVQPLVSGFWTPGVVVGIVVDGQREIHAYGHYSYVDERVPDGDTIYEIGSVTKVFTGLLLADAANRSDFHLDDPVAPVLPGDVVLPSWKGNTIDFLDLATHTSGLPRQPDNLDFANWRDPYSGYSAERLYEFLGSYELPREPGTEYDYSNLGYGLLGHALATRAGLDYEALLERRITGPLRMRSTGITLDDDQRERLAPGHDIGGRPTPNWSLGVLAGAGGIRSTANDMLTFLDLATRSRNTPFRRVVAMALKPRRSAYSDASMVALGWNVIPELDLWWHNGETGGYHGFVAIDPESHVGVVVLANAATDLVDQVGLRLMNGLAGDAIAPLDLPPVASLSQDALDRLVGDYELQPGIELTVTRQGQRLMAQLTGQSAYPVFPEGEHSFAYRIVEARLTFEQQGEDPATAVVLHQHGRQVFARRIP